MSYVFRDVSASVGSIPRQDSYRYQVLTLRVQFRLTTPLSSEGKSRSVVVRAVLARNRLDPGPRRRPDLPTRNPTSFRVARDPLDVGWFAAAEAPFSNS
jgi:hypothetical protein